MNGNSQSPDKRVYARLNLRWPVLLCRQEPDAQPVWAKTENLSSSGFFCMSPEPFRPGEMLIACVLMPQLQGSGMGHPCLHCEVEVVHVSIRQSSDAHWFGMGCRIHAYTFRNQPADQLKEAAQGNGS